MVYCFLAEGFEEIEALATVDILRRADIEVVTVGVGSDVICGAHNMKILADIKESQVNLDSCVEAIILPGGMPGTLNLEKSDCVQSAIDFARKKGIYICAICAAPSVLGHCGLLSGKKATCYPGFEKELEGAEATGDFVVRDENIITAKGAGVAIDFALEIVSVLKSDTLAKQINGAIQSK